MAVFLVCALLGAIWGVSIARHPARRRRIYEETVGLSLEQIRELLPEELREKSFTRLEVGAMNDSEIEVALILGTNTPVKGNPPNVGVVFDRRSGALLRVREAGISLGLD